VCRENLAKNAQVKIADDRCFIGFDAYKKVLEADVDLVLLATPPHFRPSTSMLRLTPRNTSFWRNRARLMLPACAPFWRRSESRGVQSLRGVGTLWRHDRPHRETYNRVSHGAIGQILGARSRYNVGQLWYAPKKKEWSDMEAMIRDWVKLAMAFRRPHRGTVRP